MGTPEKTRKRARVTGKPLGRPQIPITPALCKKVEKLSAQGMSLPQIAAMVGMGTATAYEKQAFFPEFAEAIQRGKAAGVAKVTEALYAKAVDTKDTTSMLFFLKNRAGWSDKVDTQLTGKDGKDLIPDLNVFWGKGKSGKCK